MSGARLFRRWMVLTVVLALVLVACGTEAADDTTEPDATDAADSGEEAGDVAAPEGEPIRIGSTLALTGALAPTALIHHLVGQEYADMLNEQGGLLGRPVEWIVLDDESEPETSAALYEQLITQENVDLLIGPYGTANITAAMAVAERYGYVFPHHTASLTYAYDYEWHFPTWFVGLNTHHTTPAKVFDAYLSLDDPPETVGFVINRFPGSHFVAYGSEEETEALQSGGGAVAVAEEKGLEVVLDIAFDFGTTDFAPIASRIASADPDLLYVGALGEDGSNLLAAMAQVGYQPRNHFYQWPAPGPMLAAGDLGEGATSVTIFEPFEPYLSYEGADELVDRYRSAAEEEGLDYIEPETQAGASWAAWQVLVAGVEGCGCLEQDQIADHLLNSTIPTVEGDFDFRPEEQNYGDDIQTIKQIQDGNWYVVWPEDHASDGREFQGPATP